MVITINLPHPPGVDPLKTTPPQVLQTMYPLVVAQNILTTGLIGFKIWQQHRLSAAYGIVDRNSPLSLIRILRIIVESALIYTVQIIVYMILFYIQSPWGVVVQNMIVPSLGMPPSILYKNLIDSIFIIHFRFQGSYLSSCPFGFIMQKKIPREDLIQLSLTGWEA